LLNAFLSGFIYPSDTSCNFQDLYSFFVENAVNIYTFAKNNFNIFEDESGRYSSYEFGESH
jgi:hypothetical protein